MKGEFYIAQPIPEYNPNRVKVGFSTNLSRREQDHRCTNPNFRTVKTYQARREWEKSLIQGLASEFKFLNNEVLECDDISRVIVYCDQFFQKIKIDPN